MTSLLSPSSSNRIPGTRNRKNSISIFPDAGCPPSHPCFSINGPLQIIPEQSEIDSSYPPSDPCLAQKSSISSPRLTLSAFPFSIDDALFIINDEPGSPALSTSSSTEGSFCSEELPSTPGASDDEDFYELRFPSARLAPKRVSIRPLRINKTRSTYHEDAVEDKVPEPQNEQQEEDDYDFYARQLEGFISLQSHSVQVPATAPARPESIIIPIEDAPKTRARSRFSKALPRLPPAPPPTLTLPPVPRAGIRRKRVMPIIPAYPPPPPPVENRPPPRVAVPSDIDIFEQDPRPPVEQIWFDDEESIYSQPSPTQSISFPLPKDESYSPRSSLDSYYVNSSPEPSPTSAFSFPSSTDEGTHQLRSRWSSSTLCSAIEPQCTTIILSPLQSLFRSKPRRPPPLSSLPMRAQTNAYDHVNGSSRTAVSSTTFCLPISPSRSRRRVRRQDSRSSTSSSESYESVNSSSGLKRKPIPVSMFLRARP